jgi:signal transduction histidine kinase
MAVTERFYRLQSVLDKASSCLRIEVREVGAFNGLHKLAELEIVRQHESGFVVATDGGEVFIPNFRLQDLSQVKDADSLIGFFRRQVLHDGGNHIVPCRAAGKGKTEMSRKIEVALIRKFHDGGPTPAQERISRTFTVPASQVTEVAGQLFVAGWVLRQKLRPGERLTDRRWEGEDAFRQQLEGWFFDLDAKQVEEQTQKEQDSAERLRNALEAETKRVAEAEEKIAELKPSAVREITQRLSQSEGAVKALAMGRVLQGLKRQHRDLVVKGLDAGKTATDALSQAQQVAEGEKRAKDSVRQAARFSKLEQKHGVSVIYKVWERANQQYTEKMVTVENCSVYFSGARAYIVEDDDLDSAVIKNRSSIEILST